MPLVKSKGNMYDWVTHMHTHLAGACSNRCAYCYVQRGVARMSGKYTGPARLVEAELGVRYGEGKTIFIEHMNDLFASSVEHEWRKKILFHTRSFPGNVYAFQTKNPAQAFDNYYNCDLFPDRFMIGTTIETNRGMSQYSDAPSPMSRAFGIAQFSASGAKTFITIEPIMDFDVAPLAEMITLAHPSFVNIGADSKRCHLPEPSKAKVLSLIEGLNNNNVSIRKKVNLSRILDAAD